MLQIHFIAITSSSVGCISTRRKEQAASSLLLSRLGGVLNFLPRKLGFCFFLHKENNHKHSVFGLYLLTCTRLACLCGWINVRDFKLSTGVGMCSTETVVLALEVDSLGTWEDFKNTHMRVIVIKVYYLRKTQHLVIKSK